MNSPLKIGIYVIAFPAPSETFIVTKALKLIDAGFDVQIFTTYPSKHWNHFKILEGRQDIRDRVQNSPPIESPIALMTKGVWQIISTAARHPIEFSRFIRHNWRKRHENPLGFLKSVYERVHFVGHKLDVLHVEFDTQGLNIVDLKEFLGCKLLLSARGTFQTTTILDQFPAAPEYLFKYADGYHFISRYLCDNTYKLGLNRKIPTWLIEPAVDVELFTQSISNRQQLPNTPLHLISVGRLTWHKGYEFALDAVALVHAAGVPVKYTIVGEGSYKDAIIFAASQLGLLDLGIVDFVGKISREAVSDYLHNADIMIHAAVAEGFCNAVIEGQAAGLPIVTSDAGGLPENVEDGVTGFVVPRRNPEAMAEKIIQLARDPELRHTMGLAGRERVLKRFNLVDQAQAFIKLYQELAGADE